MPVRELAHTWYTEAHCGTQKEHICNARDTRAIIYLSRSVREPPEKSAQGGSLGGGSAPYIGFIQATDPERHWATVLDTDRHRPALPVTQPTAASRTTGTTPPQIRQLPDLPLTHQTSESRNATVPTPV
jgi:hypothetical protein